MKRLKKSIAIILLFICLTACTVKNKTYNVTITINDNIEKVEVKYKSFGFANRTRNRGI